jgi:hypothetical protein
MVKASSDLSAGDAWPVVDWRGGPAYRRRLGTGRSDASGGARAQSGLGCTETCRHGACIWGRGGHPHRQGLRLRGGRAAS